MGKERQKRKELRKLFSPLTRFLNREGRRYCAVALCASLIAGNIGHMAVAASEESDYKFDLDRVALYEALQEAIAEGNTVDEDFEFEGLDADTYAISMAADGSLYELTPKIKDNKGKLQLRVFARLGEDVELVDDVSEEIGSETFAYEMDGSEEFYFLLTNTSDQEQTAVIRVGEKETDVISVIPYSDVEVPEPEGKAPVNAQGSSAVSTGTSGGGASGGSGSSGGGSSVKQETEIEIGIEGSVESDIKQDTDVKVEEGEEENDNVKAEEPDHDADITIDIDDSESEDSKGSDVSVVEDDIKEDTEEPAGDSDTSTDKGENDEKQEDSDSKDQDVSSDDTADTDSDDTGADAGDSNTDSDNADEAEPVAAISPHETYRVAASKASDSDASPSDASPSDSDLEMLDGTVLNAVRLDNASVVAFVTTAEDLKISDDLERFASSSNAGRLYEANLDTGVTVQVYANEDAFDEHVELSVKELKEDDEETAEGYQAAKDALDAENTEYTGMIALDISFLNDEGDEVEPKNGGIQVSIEMDASILPEDVIEESIAVQHLEENRHGVVENVNTVADNANADVANVDIDTENSVMTTDFMVDSFSTFTITWTGGLFNQTTYLTLNGYHCKPDGKLFEESEIAPTGENSITVNSSKQVILSDYKSTSVEGYVYKEARLGSYEGKVITRFVAEVIGNGGNRTRKVTFYNGDEQVESYTYSSEIQVDVYLVYDSIPVVLKDTVITDGCLTAIVNGKENPDGLTYEWYEVDGSTETRIETTPTLDADSYKFDYARNGFKEDNSSKTFKVVVKDSNGKEVGNATITPGYYNALKNGSFEDPKNAGTNAGPQYSVDEVPFWQTTGLGSTNGKTGRDIEILSVKKGDSNENFNLTEKAGYENVITSWNENNYTVTGVPDGNQCAELNCEAWGALYQDIVTVPGSTLYWSFYHRGRFGEDTMQLVIQGSNEKIVEAGQSSKDAQADENGYTTFKADVADGWQYHTGAYEVPEGQYITRFYFVSVDCTNDKGGQSHGDDATVGNYLDKVTFDKNVPKPLPTRGNLTITKTVSGIEAEDKANIKSGTFKFTIVSDTNGVSYNRTVELPTPSGEWSISLVNLKEGNYTVTETSTGTISGYNFVKTEVNNTDITASKSTTATVTPNNNNNVTFVNTYEPNTTFIRLDKDVAGNLGDRDKYFTFKVAVNGVELEPEYTLNHNTDPIKIDGIPLGATVTITEYGNEGYQVSANVTNTDDESLSGSVLTFKVTNANGHEVVFINTKNGIVDAGVLLDSVPYILIIGAVAAGIGFYFIRKKKDDESDLD
ncbi:MAG: DUF5979 domain-containing protein [Brotaphodocola sp.]